MKADVLVAEIGSTTTLINAFCGIRSGEPKFIGQGQAPTSVLEGDVRIGLNGAIEDLKANLGADKIEYGEMLAFLKCRRIEALAFRTDKRPSFRPAGQYALLYHATVRPVYGRKYSHRIYAAFI